MQMKLYLFFVIESRFIGLIVLVRGFVCKCFMRFESGGISAMRVLSENRVIMM